MLPNRIANVWVVINFAFLILEALLVLSQVFWDVLKIHTDASTAFQWFVTLQFSLIALYLAVSSEANRQTLSQELAATRAQLSALVPHLNHNVRSLTDQAFYLEFRDDIMHARSSVDITHLDIQPPNYSSLKKSQMKSYYDDFVALVKSKPQTRFRRVERISTEKRQWLEHLVESLADCPNFSLTCVEYPGAERLSPAISVQIVDGHKAYLVALKGHVDAHGPRDICITDPESSRLCLEYYNQRLWNTGLPILESGHLNVMNWAAIRERTNA